MDEVSKEGAALCLAAIDQIEAKIQAGDQAGIDDAEQLVLSILSQPQGAMFALQGIKAMMTWMQKDEQVKPGRFDGFWGVIGEHGTAEQRQAFADFRVNLYQHGDRVRDLLQFTSTPSDLPIRGCMDELMRLICTIPTLRP